MTAFLRSTYFKVIGGSGIVVGGLAALKLTQPEVPKAPSTLYSVKELPINIENTANSNFETSADKILFQNEISIARKSTQQILDSDALSTAYAHTTNLYNTLTDEENTISRAAIITTGGLLGLLLARKGGKFRKLIFLSGGVLSTTAVCYPKQANQIALALVQKAKEQVSTDPKESESFMANLPSTGELKKKIKATFSSD